MPDSSRCCDIRRDCNPSSKWLFLSPSCVRWRLSSGRASSRDAMTHDASSCVTIDRTRRLIGLAVSVAVKCAWLVPLWSAVGQSNDSYLESVQKPLATEHQTDGLDRVLKFEECRVSVHCTVTGSGVPRPITDIAKRSHWYYLLIVNVTYSVHCSMPFIQGAESFECSWILWFHSSTLECSGICTVQMLLNVLEFVLSCYCYLYI